VSNPRLVEMTGMTKDGLSFGSCMINAANIVSLTPWWPDDTGRQPEATLIVFIDGSILRVSGSMKENAAKLEKEKVTP
jgi:hypothetical protein